MTGSSIKILVISITFFTWRSWQEYQTCIKLQGKRKLLVNLLVFIIINILFNFCSSNQYYEEEFIIFISIQQGMTQTWPQLF